LGNDRGVGVAHRQALFPQHFRNVVFVGVGTVDSESYGSDQALRTLQYETRATLDALVNYSQFQGRGSRWYDGYGSDRLVELERLCLEVRAAYPNSVFFASRLVFERDSLWTRWLHSQTPLAMQRILNEHGVELVILPVALEERREPARPAAARA
jgi:hypothetical protein